MMPREQVVSDVVEKAMSNPVLCCITMCTINILLREQGSDKAEPDADIISQYSPEIIEKALGIMEQVAHDERFGETAQKVSAMLRGYEYG